MDDYALGQYLLYHDILTQREPDRLLYLAVHEGVWLGIFAEPIGKLLLDNQRLKLLVFDRRAEVIVRWIPLDTYRQSIEKVLCDYAQLPYAYGEVEREVVSDRHGDHYLLLAVGWDGAQRVHGSVVHIDIIDGKVWIQRDGTELALLRSS